MGNKGMLSLTEASSFLSETPNGARVKTSLIQGALLVLGVVFTVWLLTAGLQEVSPQPKNERAERALRVTANTQVPEPAAKKKPTQKEKTPEREPIPELTIKPVVTPVPSLAPPVLTMPFQETDPVDTTLEAPDMPDGPVSLAEPEVFSLSDIDEEPMALYAPAPHYPLKAKRRQVEGRVTIRMVINPEGHVVKAYVLPGHGHPMFDEAALAAARQWRFRPAKKDEKAVFVRVDLPIEFSLSR